LTAHVFDAPANWREMTIERSSQAARLVAQDKRTRLATCCSKPTAQNVRRANYRLPAGSVWSSAVMTTTRRPTKPPAGRKEAAAERFNRRAPSIRIRPMWV